MGLIDLEPDPERYKPQMSRSGSGDRHSGWLILEAAAGLGGYMGLALACVAVGKWFGIFIGNWGMVPLMTLPPLVIVGVTAYFFNSKAMLIGAIVPFCVALLSCGTCAALASGFR